MSDSVEYLRSRWTPERTAAAVRLLQGHAAEADVPTMQHDGKVILDLRGIRTSCSRSVAVRAPLREQSTEVSAVHDAVTVQIAKGGAGARRRRAPVAKLDAEVDAVHQAVPVEVGDRSEKHGQVLYAGDVVCIGGDTRVAAS